MKKVSFDYDGTLSLKEVEQYAKELINRGIEVWICTSRFPPKDAPNKEWNDDLLLVADRVGIKRQNIRFMSFANKSEFLNGKGFAFHIDDCHVELSYIETDTDVTPVHLFGNKNWKSDCEKSLN